MYLQNKFATVTEVFGQTSNAPFLLCFMCSREYSTKAIKHRIVRDTREHDSRGQGSANMYAAHLHRKGDILNLI